MLKSPTPPPDADVKPTTANADDASNVSGHAHEIAYEMAYGLSHELNNPLANIAARARLLAEQEADPQKRLMLSSIVDQAMRGCEMIADLMQFARPPSMQLELITVAQLTELVASVVERMRPWCDARQLQLDLSVAESLLLLQSPQPMAMTLNVDRAALTEALWALARNAVEVAQNSVSIVIDHSHSELVTLRVADDGPGLSAAALEKAFHPYFSGREAGRGLGLGLSKAQRWIELMQGTLTIGNRSSGGCEAVVMLRYADVCLPR